MLALLLAPAWAGSWTLQLPADQDLTDWEDALELTGLRAAAPGEVCHAQIRCTVGDCELQIRDGEAWRATAIPVPSSAEAREQIALKARSMLQARAEVHNEWHPSLGDFLSDDPVPAAPAASPPPLPIFEVSPPPLSAYPRLEGRPSSHIPAEEVRWSPALQPSLLITSRTPPPLWGSLGVSGERRSTGDFGASVGAAGGTVMLDGRLGGGIEVTAHSISRFSAERAWSTWGLAGVAWGRPVEHLRLAALLGGHLLRFTDRGQAVDTVQRSFTAAELAAPVGPLWLTLRLTTELSPITLYEVDQLGRESAIADLGTLRSGQLGVQWWLGR